MWISMILSQLIVQQRLQGLEMLRRLCFLVAPQSHSFATFILNILYFFKAQLASPMIRCIFRVTKCGADSTAIRVGMRLDEIGNSRVHLEPEKGQKGLCVSADILAKVLVSNHSGLA